MSADERAASALQQMALPLVRLAHPEALVAEHLGKVKPSELLDERYPDADALEHERSGGVL